MKTLAALTMTAALCASPAFAGMDSEHCDMTLQGDVNWQKGVLTLFTANDEHVVINGSGQITVNNRSVSLTIEQQQWVNDYYHNIETAIPMTLEITYDALELAGNSINEAFGELLGEDNGIVTDLNEMFAGLRTEMDSHFYDADGEVRMNSEDFEEDGWISERWENKFEDQVENIIANSTGRLLIAIGKAMLSGDEDFDNFEQHMENWEEDFEQRVEAKSAAIEKRADALCEVLKKADYAELQMQKHIPGLENLNVLTINSDSDLKM